MAKAQAQEPSMEEILASIRRIIADEDKAPPAEAAPAAEEAKAEEHVSEDDLDRLFASGGSDDDDEPTAAAEPDPFDIAIEDEDLEEDEDVLDLTEEAVADGDLDLVDEAQEDVTFADPIPPPPPRPAAVMAAPPEPAPRPMPASPAPQVNLGEGLLSGQAGLAVANAFSNLNHVVTHRGGHTIEELVQEMMRPMLRAWLDDNLPPMVERLVKAEIERVARGGR